jgi:hypothetical protein
LTLARMLRCAGDDGSGSHERRISANAPAAGRHQTADRADGQGGFRAQPASRAANKTGRQSQTCSPECDRLSIQPWEIADAAAGGGRGFGDGP